MKKWLIKKLGCYTAEQYNEAVEIARLSGRQSAESELKSKISSIKNQCRGDCVDINGHLIEKGKFLESVKEALTLG